MNSTAIEPSYPRLRRSPKWRPLAAAYYGWLREVVNLAAFGHKIEGIGEPPTHWNPKWKLKRAMESRAAGRRLHWKFAPHRLTKTLVQRHIDGEGYETYYFTGGTGGRTLVNLDTDTHNGEPDGRRCNEWVASLFGPHTFIQPSPRGAHAFIVLEKNGWSDKAVNDLLKSLGRALERARKIKRFRVSGVEVKGLIQHEDPSFGFGLYAGVLARLPRILSHEDLARLKQTSSVDIDYVLRLIERLRDDPALLAPVQTEPLPSPHKPTEAEQEREEPIAPTLQEHLSLEKRPKKRRKSSTGLALRTERASETLARLRGIPDTSRRIPALQLFCRLLGRVAGEEEALDFLLQHELYTPPWEDRLENRRRDVRRILGELAEQFDARKLTPKHAYDHRKLALSLLDGHPIRYDGKGTLGWQDVVIYLLAIDECVIRNPNPDGSVPYRRIKSLWPRIASRRKYKRAFHESKLRTIRDLLVRHRILEIIEPALPPRSEGGQRLQDGKAMRLTIGPKHPAFGTVRRVVVRRDHDRLLHDPEAVMTLLRPH